MTHHAKSIVVDISAPPSEPRVRDIVTAAWKAVLQLDEIDANATWSEAGGDSLKIVNFLLLIEEGLGYEFDAGLITLDMTIELVVAGLEFGAGKEPELKPPQSASGIARPIVIVAPSAGAILGHDFDGERFRRALARWAEVIWFDYGGCDPLLEGPGIYGEYLTKLTSQIKEARGSRKIHLVGYSYGARLVFDAAVNLQSIDGLIGNVAIIDAEPVATMSSAGTARWTPRQALSLVGLYARNPSRLRTRVMPLLAQKSMLFLLKAGRHDLLRTACHGLDKAFRGAKWVQFGRFSTATYHKLRTLPGLLDRELFVFASDRPNEDIEAISKMWRPHASNVHIHKLANTTHYNMFGSGELAAQLQALWDGETRSA